MDMIGSDPPAKGIEVAGSDIARRSQNETLFGGRFTEFSRVPGKRASNLQEPTLPGPVRIGCAARDMLSRVPRWAPKDVRIAPSGDESRPSGPPHHDHGGP